MDNDTIIDAAIFFQTIESSFVLSLCHPSTTSLPFYISFIKPSTSIVQKYAHSSPNNTGLKLAELRRALPD